VYFLCTAIFLYNPEEQVLRLEVSSGLSARADAASLKLKEGLAGRAAAERRTVVVNHGCGELVSRSVSGDASAASEIHLPLVFQDQLLGVISLGRLQRAEFSQDELQLLEALSNQAAVALQNASEHVKTTQALEKLQELNRFKSEIINTVSHELRTPMASILGLAELLLYRPPEGDKARRCLETIHRESVRLTTLLNDFLDLQRIESGRISLDQEKVNLVPLINDTVATYQGRSDRHSLELAIEPNLPPVWADAGKVAQVLMGRRVCAPDARHAPVRSVQRIGAAAQPD
jgi:signal transduction histidine kinase